MPDQNPEIENTVSHLFRHQAGKMVAVLTRIFGSHNIALAEDVVQDTLLTALEQWKLKGIPKDAEAWLFIVAKNKALNLIKKQKSNVLFGDEITQPLLQSGYTVETTVNQLFEENLIKDDQLRMMFACCHPELSEENQITLILKTLCGFSTAEIAKAFLTSEDTVSKRLYRTKEFFRENKIQLTIPNVDEIKKRTNAVLNSIYLIFNEGYNSTNSEELIRKDVIEESVILCKLLADNEHTQLPEVFALMALMCFHASRSESRLNDEGEIILLPMQDRNKWNRALITEGSNFMDKAAFGNAISTYHLQAGIAFEHCIAPSFEKTNWHKILSYYQWLCRIASTPVTELNRIIIVFQLQGAAVALKELEAIENKNKLESYYLYYSLLGEIYLKLNDPAIAKKHFEKAAALTQSKTEQRLLQNKISSLVQ
ncbi:MAG: sigma-70 family polymerase sigma factor [Bacteroidetes bacterium]|nr:sigma-70 family polymerase sigma factor [Bacteroidota bacterium]